MAQPVVTLKLTLAQSNLIRGDVELGQRQRETAYNGLQLELRAGGVTAHDQRAMRASQQELVLATDQGRAVLDML